ncbi:MAG: hypothetical protein J7M26_04660, partial [Armatimonadetes bacterium]|nr:hypothetical protein [Armatimonadota bacterium]
VYSEGGNHFSYCGLTDGNYGQDQRYRPATNPWLVDFDLRRMHDLCCNFGMGNPSMFYGRHHSPGRTREEQDAYVDRFLAATVAFGHPGFLVMQGGLQNALRSYYMLQQLHSRYCLSSVDEIRYATADGKLLDTTAAVATGAYKRSQIVTRYEDGCITAVNGNQQERMVVEAYGRKLDLPPNGYAGWTEDGAIEVISADPGGHRCDYAATPAYIYVDGRGKFMRFPKAASQGQAICRILGKGKYEIIPYQGVEAGFAIKATSAVALDEAGKELGPAEVRVSRGLTYVMPVKGAFSYLVQGDAAGGPIEAGLTCDRAEVVPGEKVTVRGGQEHVFTVPGDAKPGDRIWQQFEGAWIDFTVVPLADTRVSLDGNTLVVGLKSNLARTSDIKVEAVGKSASVRLAPGAWGEARLDLGEPETEGADLLQVELSGGGSSQTIEFGMVVGQGHWPVVELPDQWQAGICLRGQEEQFSFGNTGAHVNKTRTRCGGVEKQAMAMHPPWKGGVGYTFVLFPPIELPGEPAAAFRAVVGKGDGSDPGDGILYRVLVVTPEGKETVVGQQVVKKHEWVPIEADLSDFAGQTIQLKLIADVGEADNSVGDWACWAEMRVETLGTSLRRQLDPNAEPYHREPGPFRVQGLRVEDLRSAKRGWLHYEGCGLSGTGDAYGSFAVLNGVKLGNMAPAGGDEVNGVWAEAKVPLTPEAIGKLGLVNVFELDNPRHDCFKVRRFWIELELADGRKCSSDISVATYTQPPTWRYSEGILVPFGEDIRLRIWFPK